MRAAGALRLLHVPPERRCAPLPPGGECLGAALRLSFALAAGAATVFGFAPFGLGFLPLVTLAMLIALWQGAASARTAAAVGYAFGLGLFGAGASWVFIALHTFGGMPSALAAHRHRRLLRLPCALSRAHGLARRALDGSPFLAPGRRGGRRVDTGRMGEERRLHRLSVALARLFGVAGRAGKPVGRLRPGRRRVHDHAFHRAGRRGAGHRRRCTRQRDARPYRGRGGRDDLHRRREARRSAGSNGRRRRARPSRFHSSKAM